MSYHPLLWILIFMFWFWIIADSCAEQLLSKAFKFILLLDQICVSAKSLYEDKIVIERHNSLTVYPVHISYLETLPFLCLSCCQETPVSDNALPGADLLPPGVSPGLPPGAGRVCDWPGQQRHLAPLAAHPDWPGRGLHPAPGGGQQQTHQPGGGHGEQRAASVLEIMEPFQIVFLSCGYNGTFDYDNSWKEGPVFAR